MPIKKTFVPLTGFIGPGRAFEDLDIIEVELINEHRKMKENRKMPPERESIPPESSRVSEKDEDHRESVPMKVTVTNNPQGAHKESKVENPVEEVNGTDSGVGSGAEIRPKENGERVGIIKMNGETRELNGEDNHDSVYDDSKSDTSSKSNRTNKSVRFHLPRSTSPRTARFTGEPTSSGNICDGFYVLPTGVPQSPLLWMESSRPPSVQSMPNSVSILSPQRNASPAMRTRGPLSVSRQITGRYFPLKAMTQIQRDILGPVEILPIRRSESPESVKESRSRTSSRESRGRIRETNTKRVQSNSFYFNTSGRLNNAPHIDTARRMLQRDTQYNRLRSSFWTGKDTNPDQFRSSSHNGRAATGFDGSRVYQGDFFTVKSAIPKRHNSLPRSVNFLGCLEGNSKTLHSRPQTSFPNV